MEERLPVRLNPRLTQADAGCAVDVSRGHVHLQPRGNLTAHPSFEQGFAVLRLSCCGRHAHWVAIAHRVCSDSGVRVGLFVGAAGCLGCHLLRATRLRIGTISDAADRRPEGYVETEIDGFGQEVKFATGRWRLRSAK